ATQAASPSTARHASSTSGAAPGRVCRYRTRGSPATTSIPAASRGSASRSNRRSAGTSSCPWSAVTSSAPSRGSPSTSRASRASTSAAAAGDALDPARRPGVGVRVERAGGGHAGPPVVGGDQQRAGGGQPVKAPGRQGVALGGGGPPLRRVDTVNVPGAVQRRVVPVAERGRLDQPGQHLGGQLVRVGGVAVPGAAVRRDGQPRAGVLGPGGDADLYPSSGGPLEQRRYRLPPRRIRLVPPGQRVQHPAGAGNGEEEPELTVLAGRDTGTQRDQAGRGRGRERAGELQDGTEPAGEHVGDRRRDRSGQRQQV